MTKVSRVCPRKEFRTVHLHTTEYRCTGAADFQDPVEMIPKYVEEGYKISESKIQSGKIRMYHLSEAAHEKRTKTRCLALSR